MGGDGFYLLACFFFIFAKTVSYIINVIEVEIMFT